MKTALDYFMKQLGITEKSKFEITDADGNLKIVDVSEVYKISKAMEKEQIKDAFTNGDCNGTFKTINAEIYYNEIFKSE